MNLIQDIRQKHPGAYDDLSDEALADKLYQKHYSDMLRSEFDQKAGIIEGPAMGGPAWETSGASQLPAIREQVMGGKPLAQAVAAQPPIPNATQAAPSPKPLSNNDYLTGLMGQAAQGLTLGYFDEGLAAGASALGINDYEENLRRIRGLDKQFVAENPVTSFAANVVGGIPLGGPLTKAGTGLLGAVAPNAARAVGAGTATAGQRVAGGLATGAAAGTVAGSGTAEGDLADMAYGAGMGGLLGAGLGGAIPAMTSAASGAGSAALRAMPFLRDINLAGYRPFTSAQGRADQLVGQALARGGDQGAAEAAMSGAVKSQIAQPGTASVADTVLGDVSPELRSLTGAVLRSPGAGAAKAREFIATRQEGIPLANVPGQGSRLADEVSAVGGKINLRDTLDTIVEQRSAAAKPLFDQAFQVGNVINPTLSRIAQDGAVKRALAKGVVLGKRAGDIPPEYKLVIGDTVEAIPARVWHYAKMALDDQISGLRQTGKGVEARSATILKTNLINGLDEATGGAYKPALNDFAGRSALLDAAEEGRKAIASNVGPDDIQRMVSGFQTQGERDLFSQAYKSSLANMMASASRTTNAANKALLSDQQVAKIRAAFPADQADEIIKRASVRDAQFRTYAETKGSQTQPRQMAERDIEDNIQSGINLAGAAANPKGYMIGRAMEWLSNVPARAMSEKVRNALAERLVNPDPRKVATALKAVEAAAKREAARLKTVTGNRQFLSRNAAATAAMDTLGPGVSGAANMVGDAWQQGDAGDRISMLSSVTPLGDIVGPINDARNFASGKTPMTAANLGMAALGALPFVPSIAGAVGKSAAKAPEPQGITAYHGSPHSFDEFNAFSGKKGEDSGDWGGTYFAMDKDVARRYVDGNLNHNFKGKDGYLYEAKITADPNTILRAEDIAPPTLLKLYKAVSGDADTNIPVQYAVSILNERLGPKAAAGLLKQYNINGVIRQQKTDGSRPELVLFDDTLAKVTKKEKSSRYKPSAQSLK